MKFTSVFKNVGGLIIIKLLGMAVSFSIVPLYLAYFNGNESELGLWLTIFTVLLIITSLDFGIGSKLKNDLIAFFASENTESNDGRIFYSIFANVLFSLIISLIAFFVLVFKSEGKVDILIISFIVIMLSSPFRVISPILQAKQKTAYAGFITITPQLVILAYTWVFSGPISNGSKYLELIIAYFTLNSFVLLLIVRFFLKVELINLKSYYCSLNFKFSKSDLLQCFGGYYFFIVQICIIFLFSSNEIFYYVFSDSESVVHYQYYYRVFSVLFVGFATVSMPFWSAIRFYYISSDYKKLHFLIRVLFLSIIPLILAVCFLCFNYQLVLDLWLGEGVYMADRYMLIVFFLFTIFICLMYSISAVLNSLNYIKYQAGILTVAVLIKVLGIFLLLLLGFQSDVVMTMTLISLLVVVIGFSLKLFKVYKGGFCV